jgi:hypothetical protein
MSVSEADRVIRRHKEIRRIMVTMHDFHGWAAGAAWNEIQWNPKHFVHFERLAIIGEKTWQR